MLEPDIGGEAEFKRVLPPSLRLHACESDRIRLFLERKDLLLKRPLKVGITRPGTYEHGRPLSPGTLAAGTHVDVYLVHFDGPGKVPLTVTATVDFGREILGILADGGSLVNSDTLLGCPHVDYEPGKRGRGAEIQPSRPKDDTAQLSEDRHFLKLGFLARGLDEMRILVDALSE